MVGSVGTEREDEFSDVDPLFLVKAEEFAGLDADLPGVFAAAGVEPVLWWPERCNCETFRNYAILFERGGELLQYDVNIQAWAGGTVPVRPGSILFDKCGVLAESARQEGLCYRPDRLRWTVEIYWIYVYIHGKYLRRGNPFQLAAAQRELFDAHLHILHALRPNEPFDWWPLLAPRVADRDGRQVLLSYLGPGETSEIARVLPAQLDHFARDARQACASWSVEYPTALEDAVRRHIAKVIGSV
jgi:hypothetical protein